MRPALVPVFLAAGLMGCVGYRPLPCPDIVEFAPAPPERVLKVSAAQFQSQGYYAYLGNPNMVVASRSESTFWTGPAMVAGFIALPAFVVTWPIVSLVDRSPRKEATMWWPARALAWSLSTEKNTVISLKAEAGEPSGSWVTVQVRSPDVQAQHHARQVLDALAKLGVNTDRKRHQCLNVQIAGNTR